jgi:hypothetical protein
MSIDGFSGGRTAELDERIRAGTMPCDGAWPAEWVDAFDRWVQSGMSA